MLVYYEAGSRHTRTSSYIYTYMCTYNIIRRYSYVHVCIIIRINLTVMAVVFPDVVSPSSVTGLPFWTSRPMRWRLRMASLVGTTISSNRTSRGIAADTAASTSVHNFHLPLPCATNDRNNRNNRNNQQPRHLGVFFPNFVFVCVTRVHVVYVRIIM